MVTLDQGLGPTKIHHHMSDRAFGLTLSVLCAVLAIGPMLFSKPVRMPFLLASGCLLLIAGVWPVLLKWPKFCWLSITMRLAAAVNWILMGSVFYLVVTPVALFFRCVGRDPMQRKFLKEASTYWSERGAPLSADMHNQF